MGKMAKEKLSKVILKYANFLIYCDSYYYKHSGLINKVANTIVVFVCMVNLDFIVNF